MLTCSQRYSPLSIVGRVSKVQRCFVLFFFSWPSLRVSSLVSFLRFPLYVQGGKADVLKRVAKVFEWKLIFYCVIECILRVFVCVCVYERDCLLWWLFFFSTGKRMRQICMQILKPLSLKAIFIFDLLALSQRCIDHE